MQTLRLLWPWLFWIALLAVALGVAVQNHDPAAQRWLTLVVIPILTGVAGALLAFLFGYEEVAKRMASLREDRELGPLKKFWTSSNPASGWLVISNGDLPHSIDGKPYNMSLETLLSWAAIRDTLVRVYGPAVSVEYKPASRIENWTELRGKNLVFLGGHKKLELLPVSWTPS